MKQAIYIFSLYIGAIFFHTLAYFRQPAEISFSIAILAMLITGASCIHLKRVTDRDIRPNINPDHAGSPGDAPRRGRRAPE